MNIMSPFQMEARTDAIVSILNLERAKTMLSNDIFIMSLHPTDDFSTRNGLL